MPKCKLPSYDKRKTNPKGMSHRAAPDSRKIIIEMMAALLKPGEKYAKKKDAVLFLKETLKRRSLAEASNDLDGFMGMGYLVLFKEDDVELVDFDTEKTRRIDFSRK
jgi:hypothetical protein